MLRPLPHFPIEPQITRKMMLIVDADIGARSQARRSAALGQWGRTRRCLAPRPLDGLQKIYCPNILFYPKNSFVQRKIAQENPPKIVLPKIMYCIPFLPFPNMDFKSPKMLQNFFMGFFKKQKNLQNCRILTKGHNYILCQFSHIHFF